MAYEWFNNAIYNPMNSNTPDTMSATSSGVTTPFDVGTSRSMGNGTFTSGAGPAPSAGTIIPKTPVITTPTDTGTSTPTDKGVFTTSSTQNPYGEQPGAGLFTPPGTSNGGSGPGGGNDKGGGGTVKSLADAQFDIMIGLMGRYNIANLAEAFGKIRKDYPNISSADAMDLLRYDPRYNADYTKRFAGNTARAKNGFGMLDEKTYLEMEQGYSKVFKNYNLATFDNSAQYESLIGGNVDVVEAGKRVAMAYDRVLHSDPGTLNAWAKFYPQLSTADLVSIMLDPKNQLGVMERKVQSAEIGGAALTQGLNASAAAQTIQNQRYSNLTTGTIGADTIRDTGETKAMAAKDYETIAGQLPRAEFLSSIYANQGLAQYGQVEAEKANILGLASEKRKAEDLAAREAANYQGSSGTSKGAFSTQYLNRQGKSGAF